MRVKLVRKTVFALVFGISIGLAFQNFAQAQPGPAPSGEPRQEPTPLPPGPLALVVPGSEFGVLHGDIIKAINGVPVKDQLEGADKLLKDNGWIKEVTVLRKGRLLTLKKK